ncbi:MAG: hypothetical protein ACM37Z_01230 [Deltaproteobacteria bacterium]
MICGGYLIYEPEFLENPARIKYVAGDWALSDPNFRKEEPRYFPSDSVDRRFEWQQENPGYDLYDPRSAACQLGISVSFLRFSVRARRIGTSDHGSRIDSLKHSRITVVVG